MKPLVLLLLGLLALTGCASPGSPRVTFTKDVNIWIANGDSPAEPRAITVNVHYDQTSTTGIESALEQQLQDLLKADADVALTPLP